MKFYCGKCRYGYTTKQAWSHHFDNQKVNRLQNGKNIKVSNTCFNTPESEKICDTDLDQASHKYNIRIKEQAAARKRFLKPSTEEIPQKKVKAGTSADFPTVHKKIELPKVTSKSNATPTAIINQPVSILTEKFTSDSESHTNVVQENDAVVKQPSSVISTLFNQNTSQNSVNVIDNNIPSQSSSANLDEQNVFSVSSDKTDFLNTIFEKLNLQSQLLSEVHNIVVNEPAKTPKKVQVKLFLLTSAIKILLPTF